MHYYLTLVHLPVQERLATESALAKEAAAVNKDAERLLRALRNGEERAARIIQRAYRHHASMVRLRFAVLLKL